MTRPMLPALCVPLLLLQPRAQSPGPERVRTIGAVTGRDGEPWVGCRVTFRSVLDVAIPGLGDVHVAGGTTDKRGRFHVQLERGRNYNAWARRDEDGKTHWTTIETGIVPGRLVRLQEAEEQPIDVRLHVVGVEGWRELGKLELQAVGATGTIPIALDESGRADLPAGPGGSVRIVFRLDGRRLHRVTVSQLRSRRERSRQGLAKMLEQGVDGEPVAGLPDPAKLPLPPVEEHRLLLPPPLLQPITAVSKDGKKPIAGARVRVGSYGHELDSVEARTNADGEAELPVVDRIDSWGRRSRRTDIRLYLVAKGFALMQIGWSSSQFHGMKPLDATKIEDGRLPRLEAEMSPGSTLKGRVAGNGQASVAGLPVLCQLPGSAEAPGGGWYGFNSMELVRTDESGRFEVPGLGRHASGVQVAVVLPRALVGSLLPELADRLPCATKIRLATHGLAIKVPDDVTVPDVDLSRLGRYSIELRGPDGRPASFASVLVEQSTQGYYWLDTSSPLLNKRIADKRGRCVLLALDKPRLIVEHQGGWLIHDFEKAPGDGRITLQLNAYKKVTGRVVDQAGRPVEGARVSIYRTTSRGGDRFSGIVQSMNHRSLRGGTDAEGRFECRFIPNVAMTYGLRASKRIDGNTVRSDDQVEVSQEAVTDAEIRFHVPAPKADTKKEGQAQGQRKEKAQRKE